MFFVVVDITGEEVDTAVEDLVELESTLDTVKHKHNPPRATAR